MSEEKYYSWKKIEEEITFLNNSKSTHKRNTAAMLRQLLDNEYMLYALLTAAVGIGGNGNLQESDAAITNKEIYEAFWAAEEELGEHKSTEFLVAITADRLGLDQYDVVDGLAAYSEEMNLLEEVTGNE